MRAAFSLDLAVNGIVVPLKAYDTVDAKALEVKRVIRTQAAPQQTQHAVARVQVDAGSGAVVTSNEVVKVYVDGDEEFPMDDETLASFKLPNGTAKVLGWADGAEGQFLPKGQMFALAPKDKKSERVAVSFWSYLQHYADELLVEVTIRNRQHLLTLSGHDSGILAQEVTYGQEIAETPEAADFYALADKYQDADGEEFESEYSLPVIYDYRSSLPGKIFAWVHQQLIARKAAEGIEAAK